MPNPKYQSREPMTSEEIEQILRNTLLIKDEYFRLRVRCLIGLLKKWGRRRSEIAALRMTDLKTTEKELLVTFLILKYLESPDNLTLLPILTPSVRNVAPVTEIALDPTVNVPAPVPIS